MQLCCIFLHRCTSDLVLHINRQVANNWVIIIFKFLCKNWIIYDGLSTDMLTPNLCSNAGSTHMSIVKRQPLDMTLSMCSQLLWSTMARLLWVEPVLYIVCLMPVTHKCNLQPTKAELRRQNIWHQEIIHTENVSNSNNVVITETKREATSKSQGARILLSTKNVQNIRFSNINPPHL